MDHVDEVSHTASSLMGEPSGFSCLLLQIMQRPVPKPQLCITPVPRCCSGEEGWQGPSSRRRRTHRGSQPTGSAVASCSLGRVTWLLRRWSSALLKHFFTFQEHCKTVVVLFRVTLAVVSRLSGYLLAFFLETPAPESSDYIKICLH